MKKLNRDNPISALDTIKQLEAERDALAAQVEHLCYQITNIALCYDNNTGNEPSLSVFHRSLDEAQEVIEKTPAQCLAEIRAEAGRAGFIAGINARRNIEYDINSGDWMAADRAADEYAAKVRQGGAA